jgi:serine/threonine protein kinase/tetratricopeptide (TPR) repeat protein
VSRYRVLRKLGAGGMGEVWLAQDPELDREVALKFLSHLQSHDADSRARFRREAQAIARLSHPNIVTIHEVGEYQGRPYFAMEYVVGSTLQDFAREGEIPIGRAVEWVTRICDGLASAHSVGVVHRDIKPSNVIVDARERPRILDFGIASIQETEPLTRTGTTMGTFLYMSPEQAEGRAVDRRSDLFSLGVVLYELVAGRAPFAGVNDAATLRALLNDTPEPLARFRSGVPADLQRIVTRLLEREPSRRYQSADDVRDDLVRLTAAGGATSSGSGGDGDSSSIVVVPFENLGSDPDTEYFSDGLTEEIITDLGKIGTVRVISRKSSMQLKRTTKEVRDIAREFQVRYVLTGSVRRAGDSLRMNVELVEADTATQVWAERYAGTLRDVFDIQESVARAIAAALRVKLSSSDEQALARRNIRSVRAHDLYLRARQETERWTREGLDRAHAFLVEALELEPDSPVLHAALGYSYYNYVNQGFHQEESIEAAGRCVRRALELDPDSVDAMRLQGLMLLSLQGRAEEGIQELGRALELSPSDPEALWWMALGTTFRGPSERAIELSERLIRIEPFVVMNLNSLAWSYYMNGEFERALHQIEIAHDQDPTNALVQFCRAQIRLYLGRVEEANEYLAIADSRTTMGLLDRLVLVQLLALKGNRERVEELMKELETTVRRDIQYPWHLAVVRTILGDHDAALEWLGVAVDNGFGNTRFLSEHDPFLAPLRKDPRFAALMERAGTGHAAGLPKRP